MIDLHITFSDSQYQPGQTLYAEIQFQNSLISGALPIEPALGENGNGYPSQARCTDVSVELGNAVSIENAIKSSSITKTPTTERIGHAKSKSVAFSPPTSSSIGEPHLKLADCDTKMESVMIVHAQVMGTFTIDSALVKAAKFAHLKGQGMTGPSGGGVVSDASITSTRWSLASWSGVLGTSQLSSLDDLRRGFSGKALPVLTTAPTILEVEMSLAPGTRRTTTFSLVLPSNLPPSYDGRAFKISYELRLVAQRRDNSSTVYTCPIQILNGALLYDFTKPVLVPNVHKDRLHLAGDERASRTTSEMTQCTKTDAVACLNLVSKTKMLISDCFSSSTYHFAEPLQDAHIPRATARFDISRNPSEQVCVLVLPSKVYRPGQVLGGWLDFRTSRVKCLKYVVSLEMSEFICSDFGFQTQEKTVQATRRILKQDSIWCPSSVLSPFELAIPTAITGSFETIQFELQHHLHFEFSITDQDNLTEEKRIKYGLQMFPCSEVYVESFECRIAIAIVSGDGSSIRISKGRL